MPSPTRSTQESKPLAPSTGAAPKRPALAGRRSHAARNAGAADCTPNTRRVYSHYGFSPTTSSAATPQQTPAAAAPHVPIHAPAQTFGHSRLPFGRTILQAPYIAALGALPAIATGVQSIRKWHARRQILAPQRLAIGQVQRCLDTFLQANQCSAKPSAIGGAAAPAAKAAVQQLLRQHAASLALHKAAIVRAIDDSSTATASVCCELFTFLLVPLPAIHTMLGVKAGSALMRPYTTLIMPAAFLVAAGLQIAHNAERLQNVFGLWQQARQAAHNAPLADAPVPDLPALGDAALPAALIRECLYAGIQVFFWTAFACGMSATSGSIFVGLFSPPVAIVCLLIGVIGTTALHMGWANAYRTPDSIDTATHEDFGSLADRRREYDVLSQEAQAIKHFKRQVATHLPAAQAWLLKNVLPALEHVPQANMIVQWLFDRWFSHVSEAVGPSVVAHLRRLGTTRMASQARTIEALQATVTTLTGTDAQSIIATLPDSVKHAARRALGQSEQQLAAAYVAHEHCAQLLARLDAADEVPDWLEAAQHWLSADSATELTHRAVPAKIYSLLMHEPLRDIEQALQLLNWTQRVGVEADLSRS